jgi:hypothetical protein
MDFELPFQIGIPIHGCPRRTVRYLITFRVNLGLASAGAVEHFKVIRHIFLSPKHVWDPDGDIYSLSLIHT